MDLVGDEFITKWSINKNLSLMIQNKCVYNNKYYDFIKKTFSIKSSNLKKKGSNLYNFDFCNRLKEENLNLGLNHRNFLQLNFKNMNELTFYQRLKINDNIYAAFNNETRFLNCFILANERVGVIEFIFSYANEAYFLCRKLNFLRNVFVNEKFDIKSCFSLYYISNFFFVLNHDEMISIQKLFATKKDENTLFVSLLNGSHMYS
jgi:hypothetical protein